MQNTSATYSRNNESHLLALRTLAACACVAVALFVVGLFPGAAWAKSYTMPKVDISAQAQTDGSLHVTEQRTFDFSGDFTAVWWTFEGLPSNAQIKINSVRMANVNSDGAVTGEMTTLDSVPFVLKWREEGGPGTNAYSFDSPQNTVYVFFNASDEKRIVELDYTVVNGVQAYKDVADIYWKYIGDKWAESSENVTMTLALPVPQGVTVTPGDNVRAWGHGPLDGTVQVNTDGTVTYQVPLVRAGQYAEAHVVFPIGWLTNLSAESKLAHQDEMRLDSVLKDEQTWADQANRQRTMSLAFVIACGVICVLLLAWALRAYFKYGKEYAPGFTDEYWRDVPEKDAHPATIGRLWRWDRENQSDFTATLMHLSHIGCVRIDKGSYEEPGFLGAKKSVDDYYLTMTSEADSADLNPIDRAALKVLFRKVAGGKDSLWFGTIQQYAKDHPQEFVDMMKDWQGVVSAETNKRDFFEAKAKRYQSLLFAVAIITAVAGIGIWLLMDNFIPLLFMIPTAIALAIIANYMPRRSREGNDLVAKCKALRNWLRDFSSLDERPPTDVKVWGEFMVYAYIFGIAEQVIKELQTKVPEVFEDDYNTPGYVPWWFWYSPSYGSTGSTMAAAGNLFESSLSNSISTAQAAISAASGNSSSGGGFGGGFSGGGGGGFGGGGGAR